MLQHHFLQAKAFIAVLQAAAVSVQQGGVLSKEDKQQLVQVVRALQQLHKLVTKLLSRLHISECETNVRTILDRGTTLALSSPGTKVKVQP